MADLQGKCALVTGAGSGVGRGIARRLVEAGARVALGYMGSSDGVRETQTLLPAGSQTMLVEADIRDRHAVDAVLSLVISEWGRLDIMVCNAGLYRDGPFLTFPTEDLNALLMTNITGTWNCAQAAAHQMISQSDAGHIVIISSTQGDRALKGCSAYAITKSALKTMTRTMAHELAPYRIRVNSVSPGVTVAAGNIPLMQKPEHRAVVEASVPLGRAADPLEIGDAVVFLVSDSAAYITGADLIVDGGLLLNGPQV